VSSSALPVRSSFDRSHLAGSHFASATVGAIRSQSRLWLHILLLVLTLVTTSVMGARMQYNFDHSLPFFDVDRDLAVILDSWKHPAQLTAGLPFSLTLLTILLAHEMGHYLACVYYGIEASLPYFLPAPSLTGTFGAFIRIHSPIYSKRVLFDIGIAGPIAGFVFLLPALSVGLALSKVVPGIAMTGSFHPGTPIILGILQKVIFPDVNPNDLYLHPVVRAGWVGLLATAMNLLPIGQLDGGHILYALSPARHKIVSKILLLALIILGAFSGYEWIVLAVVLYFLGRKHPVIYDPEPIGRTRINFAALALFIFALSFMPAPV
jgi:membrane-associated protease RseP (regulator of RpoE activity)